MRFTRTLWNRLAVGVVAGTALVGNTLNASAQSTDLEVARFDDDTFTTGFWSWWGGIEREIVWDPSVDANGNPNSGAMRLSFVYDITNADNQYSVGMSLSGLGSYEGSVVAQPAQYSAIEFDLLWDTTSTITPEQFSNSAGDAGFSMGLAGVVTSPEAAPNWDGGLISWIAPGPAVTGGGTWQHISIPLETTRPGFAGLVFKKWQPSNEEGLNGTAAFWVDNIRLVGASTPPPPPTLSLRKSDARGVQITASASGQYQRQSIAATSEEAQATWWIDNPEPVTYSLTLEDMPAVPDFQVHVFLSPDSSGANSPDWNDPSVIFLDIRRNADGSGSATFRYKTNAPANNDMFYFQNNVPVDGRLATLATPTALGTWSLRFENDTGITLTGPGNSVTNFTMPAEHADAFRPSSTMTASFGVQPNQLNLIGSSAVFSEIKITSGDTIVLEDTFETVDPDQQVDPLLWTRRMDDPNGVSILTADGYIVSWSVPDTGFVLNTRSNLTSGAWQELQVPITQVGSTKRALVPFADLPAGNQGYFQLIQLPTP